MQTIKTKTEKTRSSCQLFLTKRNIYQKRKKTQDKALHPRPPVKQKRLESKKNLREHMIYCSFPNVIIQQIYKMERSLEPTEQDKIFHAHFSIFHLCHVESALQ